MNWQQLEDKIYYRDGSLRDIYVNNTTENDWTIWADFINKNYIGSFYNAETDLTTDSIDIFEVFNYWNDFNADRGCIIAAFFIEHIEVKTYFNSEKQIENDIMPAEVNAIEDHLQIVNYMIGLSRALNKKVILTPENSPEIELITVYGNEVVINV